jgi:predicted NAD-dependent protein-ADP-ribosyltransferase YbiA (DUF1768 family)
MVSILQESKIDIADNDYRKSRKMITFFSKKQEFRSLSNFWEQDVIIVDDNGNRRLCQTGEHCFHGENIFDWVDYVAMKQDEPRWKRTVQNSQKRGVMLTTSELELWNKISTTVQEEICRFKHDNFQEVRDDLAKSGESILIHPALRCRESDLKTRIWEGKAVVNADGQLVVLGENRLGKIWMDLR